MYKNTKDKIIVALTIRLKQPQILPKLHAKFYRSFPDSRLSSHMESHSSFLGRHFWKLGLELLLTINRAATGQQVKSDFMVGTMNFSFLDSPVKKKMGKDVSFHSDNAPGFSTWPWKTPSDTRACLCTFGLRPCMVCRTGCVCPCGLTCCLCEPQPWASSRGRPGSAQGCRPTWNTIQVNSGPLTVHTPHFTTGQTSLSIAFAVQKSPQLLFGWLKNNKENIQIYRRAWSLSCIYKTDGLQGN